MLFLLLILQNGMMHEEWNSLYKNGNLTFVERTKYLKVLGSVWLFKNKKGIEGVEFARYKARLVSKGFA